LQVEKKLFLDKDYQKFKFEKEETLKNSSTIIDKTDPKSFKLYQKKPVVQAFIKRPIVEID